MQIHTIVVPYDSAQPNARMGRGPARLLERAVEPLVGELAQPMQVTQITSDQPFPAEIVTAFELHRLVANRVHAAGDAAQFPLVLSGNCNVAVGTIAGLGDDSLGVIWLDAHGDFNTPETTKSGFFDGMGVAIIAGVCWTQLAASVPSFRAVAGGRILHLGGRDISACEVANMKECGVHVCAADELNAIRGATKLKQALHQLRERTSRVYVHLDVDVFDRADARGNDFAPPGGLAVSKVTETFHEIIEMFEVSAIGVASYDPAGDLGDRVPAAVRQVLAGSLPRLAAQFDAR